MIIQKSCLYADLVFKNISYYQCWKQFDTLILNIFININYLKYFCGDQFSDFFDEKNIQKKIINLKKKKGL